MSAKNVRQLLFVLMVMLGLPQAAHATTYWVSPCGSDAWAGVQNVCSAPLGPKLTIQAAIAVAVDGDTINVMPGVYQGQIDLDGKAITLIGLAGPASTIIDGNGAGPVVTCNSLEGPGTVIQGFRITGGSTVSEGGGMLIALASPTINNCEFQSNHASSFGGGLYAIASSATLTDCVFNLNTSSAYGAGAYFRYGSPTLTNCSFIDGNASGSAGGLMFDESAGAAANGCTFNGNLADSGGGAYARLGTASFDDCTFTANSVFDNGSGLGLVDMVSAAVSGSTFSSNTMEPASTGLGGGMYIENCAPTITNCDFDNNLARLTGGAAACVNADGTQFTGCTFTANSNGSCCGASAMELDSSDVTFFGCNFSDNVTSQYGGAIRANDSQFSVTWCGFHNNEALDFVAYGAAIFMSGFSTLEASASTFVGNQTGAGGGGAVYGSQAGASFNGCTFDSNTVAGDGVGGAIYMKWGVLLLEDCTFNNNTADKGGAVYMEQGIALSGNDLQITDSTFTGNLAWTENGGAVNSFESTAIITGGSFDGNQSGGRGGAVHLEGVNNKLTLTNVQFDTNLSTAGGGAVSTSSETDITGCGFTNNISNHAGALAIEGPFGDVRVLNSRFDANEAIMSSGAIMNGAFGSGSDLVLVNSIVSNNTSPFGTGAIYETALGAHTEVVNCAVVGNTGGGITIDNAATQSVVSNTVLWGNTSGFDLDGLMPDVMFCNIQDGGMGMAPMSVDPLFVNAATGNYHLAAGSPCIDAGATWVVPADDLDLDGDGDTTELIPYDFDGNSRFADDAAAADMGCGPPAMVDIGPYETAGDPFEDVTPGDVNGDGVVDINDLLDLLAAWGKCPGSCCPADFNLDGGIAIDDLLTLLANWD